MPLCDACGSWYSRRDRFCRHCGVRLDTAVLPAITADPAEPAPEPRSVALAPVSPAAIRPWLPTRPALVRGIATLAAGAAIELLRRRLAAKPAIKLGLPRLLGARPNGQNRHSADAPTTPADVGEEILETIVIRWQRKR